MSYVSGSDSVRAPADAHVVCRRFALIGAVSALIGSLIATGGTAREFAKLTVPPSRIATMDIPGPSGVAKIPVLHATARAISSPPAMRRDLFGFRQRITPARHVAEAPVPPSAPVAAPMVATAEETLTLIGIAEDSAPDGPRRTAIISSHDQLVLVGEGGLVGPHYRVSAITSDSAELIDVVTRATRRLEMRVTPAETAHVQ
jgi:hypothetical protein